MKKSISKILVAFLFLLALLCIANYSQANSIENIDMHIYIDSNGTANVTEKWKANLNSGTEGYKPYGDLGNCEITDFSVTDDSGKTYTTVNYWNVDSSFDSKQYKCGIHKTSNGVELCWGISNYGNRTYTLNYKITNFINQYTDSQGINFFLMPIEMDQNVKSVSLEITSPVEFTENNTQVYSFGFKGTSKIENGAIVFKTTKKFKSSNYMIAVAKFDQNYFPAGNHVNSTFEQDLAETQNYADKLHSSQILHLILIIAVISLTIIGIIAIVIVVYLFTAPELAFDGGNKIPSVKKADYWREVPCSKDLLKAYWIGEKYHIIKDKSGLIGAILLSWIQKGYITLTQTKAGLFSLKDNNYAIDLSHFSHCDNPQEQKLLNYLKNASGSNLILEHNEFEKYCEKNYTSIENWFNNTLSEETTVYENEGFITNKPYEKKFLFFHKTHSVKTASIDLREEAIRLQGLKRFLLDYSLINKRESIEVNLWEEYLIFAQLLGIADKVSEQFSKLYPDMNKLSNLNTEFTTLAVSNMSYSGYHAAHSAYMSAQSSSGGSYGGGGSHGGSSGGGFR